MEDNTQVYRDLLLKKLMGKVAEGSIENWSHYDNVSKAFPKGPHFSVFYVDAINTYELRQWSLENGFEVSFIRENVDQKLIDKNMPPLLFRYIQNKSSQNENI